MYLAFPRAFPLPPGRLHELEAAVQEAGAAVRKLAAHQVGADGARPKHQYGRRDDPAPCSVARRAEVQSHLPLAARFPGCGVHTLAPRDLRGRLFLARVPYSLHLAEGQQQLLAEEEGAQLRQGRTRGLRADGAGLDRPAGVGARGLRLQHPRIGRETHPEDAGGRRTHGDIIGTRKALRLALNA